MKNFQFIGTFDPIPLMHQIQRNPQLWDENRLRTTHPLTPHKEVSDIWVRFNDIAEYEKTGDGTSIIDGHESKWYPSVDRLPAVREVIFPLMARVQGIRLGRVLVTKLAPGRRIDPHVDSGEHAAYYERYHCVLQGLPGSLFHCGEETLAMPSGSIFWFDNKVEHSVQNNSADDRLHLIVDIKC